MRTSKLMDPQKTREYEATGAQTKKTDAYKLTDSEKTREYEVTGAQKKKIVAYKLMDSLKIDEYEMTGAQKKKTDAYKLMDSQKTREYEMTGAQKKTDEYEINGALNPCVQTRKVKKTRVCKTVHVSECGRMTELKSIITVRGNVHVKMLT